MVKKAVVAVLLDQGRDMAIRNMEMLYSLAQSRGYHVFHQTFREAPIRVESILTLHHVRAVFLDKLETLGRSQADCIRSLNRLMRLGIQSVHVLSVDGHLVELNSRTLEALQLFQALDVILAYPEKVA